MTSSLARRARVLALLLAPACSTPRADAPRTASAELAYTLRPVLVPEPGRERGLEFELACAGDADGATELSLSTDSGGVLELGSWIADVRARDARGNVLAVAHPAPERWSVTHAPGAALRVTYRVAANARQEAPDPRVHYAPIVSLAPDATTPLVHLLGGLALLLPEHLAGRERTIEWRWVDLPADWEAASVRGVGRGPFTVLDAPEHFRNAPFVAGAIDVATRDVRGRPVRVAMPRAGLGFELDALADLAARIVELQRGFFDDWEHPGYLISAVPIGKPDANGSSIGGTGLSDAFAIFLQAGTRLDDPRAGMPIPELLAHELFHHWNGGVLSIDETPQTSFWFSEGFTEWYARELQRRGGFLDDDAWLASVNRSLELYATSPARTNTADEIRDAFFTDRSIGQHAYRRGDVLALRIDQELRQRSAGTHCLDDWMRELVLRGTRGERITVERWFELLAERTDAAFAAEMRAVAIDGKELVFPAGFGGKEFAVVPGEAYAFELGFDLDATMREKAVCGVREGSAAWSAGLRDGQRLAGLSYGGADASRPVQATVLVEGGKKELEWLPRGMGVTVPRLVRR